MNILNRSIRKLLFKYINFNNNNMKNILLFFPDCPFNEDNGAGIYFKNVIRFLNKYYDVNIFV